MQGLLLIDKPAGWTSFDVVNYVRRIVAMSEGQKPKHVKVGHTGTLDPFATGLLVLMIGKDYTRRAEEFSKLDKTYEVTLRLGQISTTGDPEGEITPYTAPVGEADLVQTTIIESDSGISPAKKRVKLPSSITPDLEAFQSAVERFRGHIEQVPPAYSAIKLNGQRAYKLARAGKAVTIEPRSVTVHRLEVVDYAYPEARLVAEVSSGTYIRSLVTDIGVALHTGAYTTQLNRTTVGAFKLKDACSTENLTAEIIYNHLQAGSLTNLD